MTSSQSTNGNYAKQLASSTKSLFVWTLAWVVSNALIAFGPKTLWDFNTNMTVVAFAINLLLGLKMILVYKKHLSDMDELQRKIHFNAMAISLGCTMVVGNIFGLLVPAGLLESTPNPANLLFVMGISYLVAVFINYRRYL